MLGPALQHLTTYFDRKSLPFNDQPGRLALGKFWGGGNLNRFSLHEGNTVTAFRF